MIFLCAFGFSAMPSEFRTCHC